MTDRGQPRRTGDAGEAVAKAIIQKQGGWIARDQQVDVGIDLEAELDDPEARGQFLKIQVKTTREAVPEGTRDAVTVSKKFVRYAMECRLPVILVRLRLPGEEASYVWMQEWIEANRDNLRLDEDSPATVSIPVAADLRIGLSGRLKDIARGATPLQFRLVMREAARLAVLHRDPAALEQIGNTLVSMGLQRDAPIEAMIAELVSFSYDDLEPGHVRGVWEFHELLPLLLKLCKAFAPQFTLNHVVRLVVRGDTFSRTAVTGLGALYDTDPEHMRSLKLPDAFEQVEQHFLAFYCRLRERYLGVPETALAFGDLPLEAPGGVVRRTDRFQDKYANRGPSAFYDFWDPDPALLALLQEE